jgi:hypothetical protein
MTNRRKGMGWMIQLFGILEFNGVFFFFSFIARADVKRKPLQPRSGYTVSTENNEPEVISALPYDGMSSFLGLPMETLIADAFFCFFRMLPPVFAIARPLHVDLF